MSKDSKDLRSRIDPNDYRAGKRVLDRLGRSMQDTLEGWWYQLIHGDSDAEMAASDYHRAKADVEALKRREERLDERIDQLKEEREEVREEREQAEEHLEEAKDTLVDKAAAAHAGDDAEAADATTGNDLEDVAYELLVDVAHDELGHEGVIAGGETVQQAALRAEADADEVIEEMRRQAEPILDSDRMEYLDDPLERGFIKTDQFVQDRIAESAYVKIRRALAEEVLDEEDVEWDEVPEQDLPAGFD